MTKSGSLNLQKNLFFIRFRNFKVVDDFEDGSIWEMYSSLHLIHKNEVMEYQLSKNPDNY